MRYKIYDSEGKTEKSEVKELEYNGVFKGERYITAKVESPYPVDFKIGDRLTYHGEVFTLRDISSIKRNARNYQSGKSIEYDGLRFLGTASDLYDIQFCDYVLNDNNLPYTGLGTFSFYVSKAEDFGSRIQANLDLNYGEGKWQVEYGDAKDINKAKTMSISADTNVYDALIQFSNDYDVNFVIKGYTITIGFTQEFTEYEYFYGKGHGLTSLEVTTDSNQRIVTRLKAYGSQRNIPYLYYANLGKEYVVKASSAQEAAGKENTLIITVDLGMDYDENDSVFTDSVNAGSQTGWYDFRISLRAGDTEVYGMIECNGSGSLQPQNEAKIYVGPEYYESDTNAIQQLISYFNSVGAYPVNVYITKGYDITKVPSGNINVPSGMPNNMSVKNLMLPGFPGESLYDWAMRVSNENTETGSKVLELINEGFKFSENQYFPYIISPNADTYGIKDGEVTFDGSDEDWDEVYPSLEGMTTSELSTIAGYEGSDTFEDSGEVDRMLSDSGIEDNGVSSDGTYGDGSKDTEGTLMYASFEMTIPNIGFNLWDYKADGESPVIHMQDGMCTGRSFEILRCIPVDADDITKGYRLNLQRELDQNVNMYYPNRIYNISAGDEFVLEGIEIPDVYVEAASVRLFFQSIEKLRDIDYLEKTYKPEIDNIFMARNPKYAENLYEGIKMCIADNDLGIVAITVSQLNIKEADGQIPKYEVTLEDESSAELLSLSTASGSTTGTQTTGQSIKLIRTNDNTTPTDRNAFSALRSISEFLNKNSEDTAKEKITFEKGAEFGKYSGGILGSGAAILIDENGRSHQEVDYLTVRRKATYTTIDVQELKHIGGELILSPAAMTIKSVEETANGYKCYFETEDEDGKKIYNEFVVGDQGRCHTFNLEKQGEQRAGNRYWWRLVVETGDNFVVFSKSDADENSDAPIAGDKVAQLGNRTDTTRQNAQVYSAYGQDAPSRRMYQGIDSYSLVGKAIKEEYYDVSTGRYKEVTYGDAYFGDREGNNYVKYNTAEGVDIKGKVQIKEGSTGASNLEDLGGYISESVKVGAENLLLNTGFTGSYETEVLKEEDTLESDTKLYSENLENWEGKATVVEDTKSISGYSVKLGYLSQDVDLINGEKYVISYKAKDGSVKISCGEFENSQETEVEYKVYSNTFTFSGEQKFRISGTANVCEIKLERGTIATDWCPSRLDKNPVADNFKKYWYLMDALKGTTEIDGGLILTSIIRLGQWKDGKLQKVNSCISGIYNDDEDVAFSAGGDLDKAIYTTMLYKNNPTYIPTEKELKNIANCVITHGGRAILNDVILRGYIYALGGVFNGTIYAEGGEFGGYIKTSFKLLSQSDAENGNFDVKISDDSSMEVNGSKLSNDLNIYTYNTFNNIVLPNDKKYIGSHVFISNTNYPPYTRLNIGNITSIFSGMYPFGFKGGYLNASKNTKGTYVKNVLGGIVEFVGIPINDNGDTLTQWVCLSEQNQEEIICKKITIQNDEIVDHTVITPESIYFTNGDGNKEGYNGEILLSESPSGLTSIYGIFKNGILVGTKEK